MKYFVTVALLAVVAAVAIVRTSSTEPPAQDSGLEREADTARSAAGSSDVAASDPLMQPIVVEETLQEPLPDWTEVDPPGFMAGTLELADYGLFPTEVKCHTLNGAVRCRPVPGTLQFEHPYFTYPTESLEAMTGDAIANHVLGLRLARKNPEAAFEHIIKAVGLSGKPGSLTDFYHESGWNVTAVDGKPAVENMKKGLLLLSAAERLGHKMARPAELRTRLQALISTQEMAKIDAAVDAVVDEVNSIEITVEYQS